MTSPLFGVCVEIRRLNARRPMRIAEYQPRLGVNFTSLSPDFCFAIDHFYRALKSALTTTHVFYPPVITIPAGHSFAEYESFMRRVRLQLR
jgi:hypothetical protein